MEISSGISYNDRGGITQVRKFKLNNRIALSINGERESQSEVHVVLATRRTICSSSLVQSHTVDVYFWVFYSSQMHTSLNILHM